MTTLTPLSISISTCKCHKTPFLKPRTNFLPNLHQPIKFHHLKCTKIASFGQYCLNIQLCAYNRKVRTNKDGILWGKEKNLKKQKRVVLVKQGLDFNGGNGGGGDKRDDGTTARVLGNLALAVGLTYLTMTGNLGWVLDTIVSLWLLAVIIPVIGIVAFLWWAGKDIVEGACPNCGNAFQVLKSSLNDELPLCPYCSQPFSVEGNEFIKEPINFSSKRSTPFGQTFDDFSPWSRKVLIEWNHIMAYGVCVMDRAQTKYPLQVYHRRPKKQPPQAAQGEFQQLVNSKTRKKETEAKTDESKLGSQPKIEEDDKADNGDPNYPPEL